LSCFKYQILVSIGVSIPACHAGDPGSIPGLRDYFKTLIPLFYNKNKFYGRQ
jgi:hypothetical protein